MIGVISNIDSGSGLIPLPLSILNQFQNGKVKETNKEIRLNPQTKFEASAITNIISQNGASSTSYSSSE